MKTGWKPAFFSTTDQIHLNSVKNPSLLNTPTEMKKTWLVAFTLLAVVLALVVNREQRIPSVLSSSALTSKPSIQAASTPAAPSSPAAPAQSFGFITHLTQILPQLEVAFNQPISIEHGGALRDLVLAKDELYVRNADGVGRVVTFPPASSAADLLQQWQKTQKETGSAPELVLYPPGAPRNESTRRIVTRDLLIEADTRSAADALAGTSVLGFKSAPVFAPGKYIYEAPSSHRSS